MTTVDSFQILLVLQVPDDDAAVAGGSEHLLVLVRSEFGVENRVVVRLESVDRVHSLAVDQVDVTVVLGNDQVAISEFGCNGHCRADLWEGERECLAFTSLAMIIGDGHC